MSNEAEEKTELEKVAAELTEEGLGDLWMEARACLGLEHCDSQTTDQMALGNYLLVAYRHGVEKTRTSAKENRVLVTQAPALVPRELVALLTSDTVKEMYVDLESYVVGTDVARTRVEVMSAEEVRHWVLTKRGR